MWAQFAVVLCGLHAVQAVNVYLFPQSTKSFLRPNLAPEDASAALSHHLGLELFDTLRDGSALNYAEQPFVGQGPNNALLLTLEEADAKAVIPSSLPRSFRLPASPSSSITSLYSVVSTYLHRAQHAYTSIYASDPSLQTNKAWFLEELASISSFFDKAESGAFAAAELSGLANMRKTYGVDSEEYQTVLDNTRKLLERAMSHNIHIALLSFSPPPVRVKRADDPQVSQAPFPRPPPQSPIGSISTCHTSLDTCTNSTSSCSGRGECVSATKSGRTCFVCSCGTTTTGQGKQKSTEIWVGESCERKDISGPFVLFTGTTIVLLLVIAGSIALLSSVGNVELPSVLLGGAVNGKKD
ncbi:hypothetical protein FB45DRAFT_925936 [Roridomyces roridus]|uniref:Vacuolar sorting protein Vps3844 C-terminal domain-containing protein n=1 Tax=Roridomyces roridus TaxID=1738132 RepID=A0AAD7BK84_9AGAR|nr:hypothetical protein FB45DRAFT_925936 [Roridomyces roridus]